MKYGLQLVTAPASEPITLDDAREHLRVRDTREDSSIAAYVKAARAYVESVTGRQLVTATWRLVLDRFPGRCEDEQLPYTWRYGTIRVPRPPLVSVSSVQYVDTDGVLQVLATSEYQVSTIQEPGRVAPARFKVWPVTDPQSLEAVRVEFVAGYTDVPDDCRQAVRLLVGHLYENREATVDVALSVVPLGLQMFVHSCGYGEYV